MPVKRTVSKVTAAGYSVWQSFGVMSELSHYLPVAQTVQLQQCNRWMYKTGVPRMMQKFKTHGQRFFFFASQQPKSKRTPGMSIAERHIAIVVFDAKFETAKKVCALGIGQKHDDDVFSTYLISGGDLIVIDPEKLKVYRLNRPRDAMAWNRIEILCDETQNLKGRSVVMQQDGVFLVSGGISPNAPHSPTGSVFSFSVD